MSTITAAGYDSRWRTAAAFLEELRRSPGATRAALARRLGVSTGSAADVVARLRRNDLVAETAAAPRGRGRPSTTLHPHPHGPLVVLVDLRHGDWRCAVAGIDGIPIVTSSRRHRRRTPMEPIAAAVEAAVDEHDDRVVAVSVAVAGTVQEGQLVQASTLDWPPIELATLVRRPGLPLLIGNDATLAGLAEGRTGAGRGAGTSLHLTVEVGVGGVLLVDGRPAVGARGAAGEFGHLPFGDRRLRCPCGATGCWDLEVDGRAMARHRGHAPPADPRRYADDTLRAAETDAMAGHAVETAAGALASGIAGLVNAHDPEVVTIGGLGPALRRAAPAAFDAAYRDGLMAFHRPTPPAVVDAHHGAEGPLHGAAIAGLDEALTEPGLAAWARARRRRSAS